MTPSPARISVVLPVYNGGRTLRRALESVRTQTLDAWELVAVDDGSTDDSFRILEAAQREDPRIRPVRIEHTGIARALNAGIAAANSPLIARLDADDECFPDRLRRLCAAFDENPDLGVIGSLVEYGGDRAAHEGYATHVDWVNSVLTPADIARQQFVESPFAHPSVAFRRSLMARLGGYREGPFPEDYELWLRWLAAGIVMAKVPETLLRWNDPAERLSRQDPRYSADAFYQLKAVYLARWLHRHVPAERPVLVWGAGRLTRRRVGFLEEQGTAVQGFIDIDVKKCGRLRDGRTVRTPEELGAPGSAFLLGYVANRGARGLQRAFLEERGWTEGTDFLFVA